MAWRNGRCVVHRGNVVHVGNKGSLGGLVRCRRSIAIFLMVEFLGALSLGEASILCDSSSAVSDVTRITHTVKENGADH